MLSLKSFSYVLSILVYSSAMSIPLHIKIDESSLEKLLQPNSSSTVNPHPLSSMLQLRENISTTFHSFPLSPDCSQVAIPSKLSVSATVSMWIVDQKSHLETGALFWKEKVYTRCSFGFFGEKKATEDQRKASDLASIPNSEEVNKVLSWVVGTSSELDIVAYEDRYSCYWCRNEYPGSYNMRYGSHVSVSRFADGSLKSPPGQWVYYDQNIFFDGSRYLFIHQKDGSKYCPLKLHDMTAGVISSDGGSNVLVSLPTLNLQFSLDPLSKPYQCHFPNKYYNIERSRGGYLISVDAGASDWRNILNTTQLNAPKNRRRLGLDSSTKRLKRAIQSTEDTDNNGDIWEFMSNVRTSTSYAQLRYEQKFVVDQMNKNLGLLQKVICESMFTKWISLIPQDLPRKIAMYLSGTHTSIASEELGAYKVTTTAPTKNDYELYLPINITYGMYKVYSRSHNVSLWAEPVTGNLFTTPFYSHFSMIASWLPGVNGSGVNPITGKIMLPEVTMARVSVIKQADAFIGKPLYNQIELDFRRVQSSSKF